MNIGERIRLLVASLPSESASVTFTRADLAALLEEVESPPEEATQDLTADEVAAETRRAPSTVRSWLIAGNLRGYKLNGRDWRVPREALREFLDAQTGSVEGPGRSPAEVIDITEWRKPPR